MARPSVERRRKRQRGSNLIESALVFLGFMLLVLGSVEFGRMVYAFNTVCESAREGARWASVRGSSSSSPATNATVTTYVKQWAVGLDASQISVNTSWTPNNNPGGTVQVSVTYTWSGVVGVIVPRTMSFTSQSNMVVLQ